jgi:hypothetical protein
MLQEPLNSAHFRSALAIANPKTHRLIHPAEWPDGRTVILGDGGSRTAHGQASLTKYHMTEQDALERYPAAEREPSSREEAPISQRQLRTKAPIDAFSW